MRTAARDHRTGEAAAALDSRFSLGDFAIPSDRIAKAPSDGRRSIETEARARDVKILFEDAATGARSPALVRQGQIGEIVSMRA